MNPAPAVSLSPALPHSHTRRLSRSLVYIPPHHLSEQEGLTSSESATDTSWESATEESASNRPTTLDESRLLPVLRGTHYPPPRYMHTQVPARMDHDLTLDDEFDALRINVRDVTKYPAKQHARKVVKQLGVRDGLIYLPGQPERLLEDSDQPQLFRQRRYFFYLSGANFEDCVVTYEIAPDKLTLWIPYVEPRQILWFGSKPSACECLRRYDVDQVRYTTQLSKFLKAYAASPKSSPTVYILHPDQAPDLGNGGDMTKSHMLHLDHALLKPAMDRSRLIKTDHEVALIRRANDISSAAHRRVAENMLRLSNERQIEAIIQAVCIANGARSQAYPIIAGSGRNASTLHYTANNAPLEGKQSVVIDAGCEWECYASDITRTLPLSGSFTPRAGAIHAIVQRMQDECIREVRPGKLWREIHLLAASIGLDGLLNLGILKGHRDEIARAGTVAAFFPHGLGHHVGLDVHDVSSTLPLAVAQAGLQLDYGKRTMVTPAMYVEMMQEQSQGVLLGPQERKRQHLETNMVVTVEPGIYFCREYLEGYFRMDPTHCRFIDWDILEGYYEVGGVRIEDCILVTEDGHENLTAAPKGDELLDVINKGRR